MHSSEKDKVVHGNTSEMVIFNYPLSTNAKLSRTKVSIKNTRKLVWSNGYKLTRLIGKEVISGKLWGLTTSTSSKLQYQNYFLMLW